LVPPESPGLAFRDVGLNRFPKWVARLQVKEKL